MNFAVACTEKFPLDLNRLQPCLGSIVCTDWAPAGTGHLRNINSVHELSVYDDTGPRVVTW